MLILVRKVGITISISDKLDFRAKNITRNKEDHFVMVKWSVQKVELIVLNIYTPNKLQNI